MMNQVTITAVLMRICLTLYPQSEHLEEQLFTQSMRPSKITFLSLETILSNSPLLLKLLKKNQAGSPRNLASESGSQYNSLPFTLQII